MHTSVTVTFALPRIQECSDLAIINGSCDPYATVTMIYTNKKQETKRTKVKKKTVTPHFDEVFIFEVQLVFFQLKWVNTRKWDKNTLLYPNLLKFQTFSDFCIFIFWYRYPINPLASLWLLSRKDCICQGTCHKVCRRCLIIYFYIFPTPRSQICYSFKKYVNQKNGKTCS